MSGKKKSTVMHKDSVIHTNAGCLQWIGELKKCFKVTQIKAVVATHLLCEMKNGKATK